MAQAARLNLRMQKELKLLMTDPPPGVSLPLLSDNDNNLVSSSLTSIDARIEGPEGTVYAKGIFTVRIQIPERYPFQPPNVTFITPIYHPNIDNGGRICLDILNLPPKGAWQPSLNISTVLTSIGLLLSDPNPDDGLMAEASREYKYNRQAFDQKARSWTDIYANAGAIGRSNNDVMSANQSMKEVEKEDVSLKNVDEIEGSRKKLQLGEKLSLKSAVPVKTNCSNNKENIKLQPGEKLSLKSAVPGKTNCSNNKENLPPRQLSISCSQNPPIGMKCDNKPPHEYTHKAVNQNLKPEGGQSNDIETIIVSDSEDSDEEIIRNSRLRFPLMRKQLTGKRKGMH